MSKDGSVDFMLDLETLGKKPGCAVLSIGLCAFDENGPCVPDKLGGHFYEVLDVRHQVENLGTSIDADAVLWWLAQSDAARLAIVSSPEVWVRDTKNALLELSAWLSRAQPDANKRRLWGNGAAFDAPILLDLYSRVRLTNGDRVPLPWVFWNERCFRTVKALYPHVKYDKPTVAHNALEDALAQARHVAKMCAAGMVLR